MESSRVHILGQYWTTLLKLLSAPSPLATMDTPIPRAFVESRAASGWSGLLLTIGLVIRYDSRVGEWLSFWSKWHSTAVVLSVFILAAACLVGALATYGLVRLYTLVSHVMISNVFKVRGQRLRLLNIETALLPLTAPIALGIACSGVFPWLGWPLMIIPTLYGLFWFSIAHNAIFHKHRLDGLTLVVGGMFLTSFVFCVGAIAVTVGIGVIGFLMAALLRPIHRG